MPYKSMRPNTSMNKETQECLQRIAERLWDGHASVFVGAGYRQYSYNGSFVYFLVLYNLSWGGLQDGDKWDTPYASPISLRVGYCF